MPTTIDKDRKYTLHPYSSLDESNPLFAVKSATGCTLTLEDGRELIDGMSSWWCAIHGYNVPQLNHAIEQQLESMAHVMFGGLTHQSAVDLCEKLVELTPENLNKVFLSDSGSVSVEVAVKMALQYFIAQGRSEKKRIMTLEGAYHGDTFMAMSLCDPVTGMHHLFSQVLPEQIFAPRPKCKLNEDVSPQELQQLQQLFEQHHHETAAFIVEPVVQGAGGMHFYSPDYLIKLRELCDEYDVLLIFDEIATGFGRTGKLFALEWADIHPDILCLGKSLTGGYMTLAATLCNDKLMRDICSGEAGAFMHGPTFMANPLACAVALKSIELLQQSQWQEKTQFIERLCSIELQPLTELASVAEVRCLGAIAVVEMKQPVDMKVIQPALVQAGIWVRPFGKLIYLMPPFVISAEELSLLCRKLTEVIKDVT